MTIRHFRIFIAVAKTESITKAAQSLYVTQPTVSVAIREMEQHYGTHFFDRINQRLRITEEGKALLSHATHLISIYDDIETSFQNPDALGILRIGASVNIGSYYLPEYIQLFEQQFPNIRVQVRVTTTEVIEKLLLENQLDLAIVGGIIHSPFIKLSPVFSEAHIAVCCPTHSMAGKTVSLSEFVSQPLLFRERNSGAFRAFQSAVSQLGYPIEPAWESSSQEAILEAASLNLGVTILPEKLAKKEFSKNQLAQIHISDFSFQNTVCLAYHKSKFISPAMRHFIDLVFSIKY